MNHLKKLQESFQAYLLNKNNDAVITEIISTPSFSSHQRLFIYNHAYQSRLINALASNYIFLKQYLGDTAFNELAISYIAEHPSHFRSIRWVGDKLSGFLCDDIQREIATFDWIMTLVFDAKDAPHFTLSQMSSIPPDSWAEMTFVIHPSLHTHAFKYNVIESWQRTSITIEKYPTPMQWIFWRHDLNTRFIALSQAEACCLNAALAGSSFADICEGLCVYIEEENVAITAATFLKKWIALGLISNIHCSQ